MTLLDTDPFREGLVSLERPPELGVHIKTLNEDRLDEVEDFFVRLDRDTRCRRFGHAASDDALRVHAAKAITQAANVIGIYAGGDLRGVLELYSCAPHPFVETALVVEMKWRQRGL